MQQVPSVVAFIVTKHSMSLIQQKQESWFRYESGNRNDGWRGGKLRWQPHGSMPLLLSTWYLDHGGFNYLYNQVALVRMTSDGRLPPAERRGYTSVFNAIARIGREEGVLALWRVSLRHCLVKILSILSALLF